MRSNQWLLAAALVPFALSACTEGGSMTMQATAAQVADARSDLGVVPPMDTAAAANLSGAFRAAAHRALPAVVQVRVQSRQVAQQQRIPFPFPGLEGGPPQPAQGTGSGFLIDAEGHILTNNHVIANADRVNVVLADGRDYEADVVGGDPNTDVAVVRIRPRGNERFPVAEFGDSDDLRVGDWVLALGNPLGLNFTVTAGIVSAMGRNIGILGNEHNTQIEAFIQTDAAINPGNSGGPLVDLMGRVIGINTAISSRTGFFAGAGFAVPINLARKVGSDLIRYGVVHRPRLGVEIRDVTAADAEVFRLPDVAGAAIVSLEPDEAAVRAGLQMGDVIVAINGDRIRRVSELQDRVARFQPGERIRVHAVRYGREVAVDAQLGEFEPRQQRTATAERARSGMALLGFRVSPITGNVPNPDWKVTISEVDAQSPAAEFLQNPGAVLLSINGQKITSVRDVERAAGGLRPGDVVSIVIADASRDGRPRIFNYRTR
jgi:serine protease Do